MGESMAVGGLETGRVDTMEVEQISYNSWDKAYRCKLGEISFVVIADVGPRIISLSYGDRPNILFEDANDKYRRGDWRLYGGHRFWVGPETEHAFLPENEECDVETGQGWISVTQPKDIMGIQKTLKISAANNGKGLCLNHIVKNAGTLLHTGCIWTLTCVLPSPLVIPWLTGSGQWQSSMVCYWRRWEHHTTDPADRQWQPHQEYFLIDPDGSEGKIGFYSEEGLIAWLGREYTFVKMFEPVPEAHHPDGGCNIEAFTCPDFVEMETLSPNTVFHPGRSYSHIEQWHFVPEHFEASDWRRMKNSLPCP